MSNLLDGIAVTEVELRMDYNRRHRATPSREICVCGHGYNCHTENVIPGHSKRQDEAIAAGKRICVPSKYVCPCSEYIPVLTTEDVRMFQFVTEGPGALHALSKGVANAKSRGVAIEWMDIKCFHKNCHKYLLTEGVELEPVPFDGMFRECYRPSDRNAMLCMESRVEIVEDFVNQGLAREVMNPELQIK